MSRGSNGSAGSWAEEQRRRQREQERQQRARQRELERSQREQRAAYRQQREADARRRTEELDARVASLQGLLAAGIRAPAFRADSLMKPEQVASFSPRQQIAYPVRMPDPNLYQPQGGWTRARRAQAQEEARARYERDLQAAQAAEASRQQQWAADMRRYEDWAQAQLAEICRHNASIREMTAALGNADARAAVRYFSAALDASTAWPEGLPRRVMAAYDSVARELVLNWELPRYDVIPETKSVRYRPTADRDEEKARPVTQRRALYSDVLAQCLLLVLHELFAADEFGALESVVLNGFVDDHDPATGRRAQVVLATVRVARSTFADLRLDQVNAVDCLVDGLQGQLAARPDQRATVRPIRAPDDVRKGVSTHGGDEEPDLYEMDPFAFESLVADLFRAMGMQAVRTQRSNDGGVDVDALDPTPISGGKIVVQVKRYRNLVPPSAVRDLYGTVQDAGANKGVLVTTSRFGHGSHTFAKDKPLELLSGAELVRLLHEHGLRGQLGSGDRTVPAQRNVPEAESTTGDHNTLGMYWSGSVALDICALVCEGTRVLSDDHFVFYNNPRTPDGAVGVLTTVAAPDKAAIRVSFDALPVSANRLYIVAAIDPIANPHADLSGFTGAGIRLLDSAGAELDRLEVFDGRPRETALVLGSFRRRTSGDWEFVVGRKGYQGGLEELIQEYGVEVG